MCNTFCYNQNDPKFYYKVGNLKNKSWNLCHKKRHIFSDLHTFWSLKVLVLLSSQMFHSLWSVFLNFTFSKLLLWNVVFFWRGGSEILFFAQPIYKDLVSVINTYIIKIYFDNVQILKKKITLKSWETE